MTDPPPIGPWAALESIPGLSALPDVWQAMLGKQFPAFKILCLQDSPRLALSVPCPRRCGCYHTIIHRHDRTGAIAICRCHPATCPDIPVTIPEITPLDVNRPRLARALCKALGCQNKTANIKPATIQFGAWSADSIPALLTIQTDPFVFRAALVTQFDSETLTVFRLYCIEAMSAAQAARRLRCSKTTVIRRLDEISRKTGVHPKVLRMLFPHLDRIKDALSDSRASHIHRENLLYDDPDP